MANSMNRIRKLDEDNMKSNMETRIALVEQNMEHIADTLVRIDKKIDQRFDETGKGINARFDIISDYFNKLDNRINKMENRLDRLDNSVANFNDRIWSSFLWTLSTMLGIAFTGLSVLAKGFGWL
jgi:flagellar capping protein FliD